jgi:hypothetical protein
MVLGDHSLEGQEEACLEGWAFGQQLKNEQELTRSRKRWERGRRK